MQAQWYRPNAENVAAEIIDEEAIIINVATGNYYNTEGIGGWVWEKCVAGMTVEQIAASAGERFDASAEQIGKDLQDFFASLAEENLVVAAQEAAQISPQNTPAEAKLPYRSPKLVAYRDLRDLLALDPPMPRLGSESFPASGAR